MKAVYIKEFGGPDVLELREIADPSMPSPNQVLVRVRAAGLNRADLLQRKGLYPPPPGLSKHIPGLEFAGEAAEIGGDVSDVKAGDRVFGLASGEAQAEYILIDRSLVLPIPADLSFTEAAAVPEAFVTAHDAIVSLGELRPGDTLLVHAVSSGVGLAALQIAKSLGARIIGTSRTAEKLERCSTFGLDKAVLVSGEPLFAEEIVDFTGGRGADVVLDLVGAAYFQQHLKSLSVKGRLVLVGLLSGTKAEFDLGIALGKRAKIIGTVLRSRDLAEKASAVRAFAGDVIPMLAVGAVRPVVDRVFKAADVTEAHKYLESNKSFGKVVLEF